MDTHSFSSLASMAECKILMWLLIYFGVLLGDNIRAVSFFASHGLKFSKRLDSCNRAFF